MTVFRGVDGAWLSGGSALAGFHLDHRRSKDIDVFAADASTLVELERRLVSWCALQGLEHAVLQRYPGFQRHRIRGGDEHTLVDLVHEPVPQLVPLESKPMHDAVRVDSMEEIAANKLAALLGRSETKDLLDLRAMAAAGLDPLAGFTAAQAKDGGLDAATLAWVLSELQIDLEGLDLLDPVTEAELDKFRSTLIERLQRMAFPVTP